MKALMTKLAPGRFGGPINSLIECRQPGPFPAWLQIVFVASLFVVTVLLTLMYYLRH